MRKIINRLVITASVLIAAGCIPEKRIVWSPDGRTGAVCTPNGLFLIDSDGMPLPGKITGSPTRCAWFKDGRQLAVIRADQAQGWDGIADLFSKEEQAKIADEAKAARLRILAFEGDLDSFKLDPDKRLSPGQEEAIIMYMRDRDNQGLAEKNKKQWDELAKATASIWQIQLYSLSGNELKPGKVLIRSLDEIRALKISPTENHLAFTMPTVESGDDDVGLHVLAISGGQPRMVSARVGLDFDWSPNGRELVFIRSTSQNTNKSEESIQLGSLTTVMIIDEKGALMPQWGPRDDRVGMLFSPVMGVRWLKDGRILFAASEVTLPATSRDMPQRWSLFVLDPRLPASVVRALGRDFPEALEPSLALFEVSPNEESVLLPGPKGRVSIYDFRSGSTNVIQTVDDPDGKVRSIPSWRNDKEICMVAPIPSAAGQPATNQVVLWSAGKARMLSTNWSPEMREGWMDGK